MHFPEFLNNCLKRMVSDRSGNFSVMTALAATPMLLAAGIAVDLTAALVERSAMQAIVDASALSAASEFDGINFDGAERRAKAFMASHRSPKSEDEHLIRHSGREVEVTMRQLFPTSLSRIGGFHHIPISVSSTALSPLKPKDVSITPTHAQGHYYKVVTVRVVRPNSSKEEVVGTITYQPMTINNRGQGTLSVLPTGKLELGEYTKLVLQMNVKKDSCAIGFESELHGNEITCHRSSTLANSKYDLELRTDDPQTTHYLFVEDKQLAEGGISPLNNILPCGTSSNHAWEDGGAWERQDFFYDIKVACVLDKRGARLIK